jgi:RNA polymerase primary sigma factor
MIADKHGNELQLVAGVKAGKPAAMRQFLALAGAAIWPVVLTLVSEGPAAEGAFLSVLTALKANDFARLSRYDGRSRLSTFLTLVTRDVLGEEVAQLFSLDRDHAWRRFDRLFARDIRLCIRRRFPNADEARREDLFQDISASLLEQDFRRIRAYDGRGSFCGYILLVVDRLLIDRLRQEVPRRRLPAEIARLPELHKLLFAAGAWQNVPLHPERMAEALRGKIDPPPTRAALETALKRVAGAIALARSSQTRTQTISVDDEGTREIASPVANAEEALMSRQADSAREAVLDMIRQEAETLPADQQLYLRLLLEAPDPRPARDIARELAVPVMEVYRLQQQTQRWIKKIAAQVQKNAGLPV